MVVPSNNGFGMLIPTDWNLAYDAYVIPSTCRLSYIQHVLCRYGAPAVVTTDNGVEFHGELEELLLNAMIDHRYTSRAHPQANGQAERAVQTMKSLLRRMAADPGLKRDWDVHVHWAAMGYHLSIHRPHRD